MSRTTHLRPTQYLLQTAGMADLSTPDWPVTYRLRRALDVAGLSRPQLAAALHKSLRTVDGYMAGSTRPDYSTMRHIAEITGVKQWWLEGKDGDDQATQDVPEIRWFRDLTSAAA